MKISIVVAVSKNKVIGKENHMPWHIPEEIIHFKKLTEDHHILMGRKTHESIGKPLPKRTNLIISRNQNYESPGCIVFNELDDAIEFAKENGEKELMIIGGEKIYKMSLPLAEKIYMSVIQKKYEGDSFFPDIDTEAWEETHREIHDETNPPFEIRTLERKG